MQWAAPDLRSKPQIAVGNAGPPQGAPDCSGQRRTSPGGPWSGLSNVGPQLPQDMSKDMSEICQPRMSEDMLEEMSEDMSIEM